MDDPPLLWPFEGERLEGGVIWHICATDQLEEALPVQYPWTSK